MNDEQIDILADTHLYVGHDTRHSGAPTAVVEGYREFARALLAASASAEPVGIAGSMPGTDGFTMAAFKAEDVPIGTELYTRPIEAPDNKK